jgi:hypothetical protein
MIAKERELLLQHKLEMERRIKDDEVKELRTSIARLENIISRRGRS